MKLTLGNTPPLACRYTGVQGGWVAGWLAGLVGWWLVAGWLAGLAGGWLAGWLAGIQVWFNRYGSTGMVQQVWFNRYGSASIVTPEYLALVARFFMFLIARDSGIIKAA